LSESAAAFPWRSFKQYFEKVGFIDVIAIPQTFEVATYSASKK
jgi:demethylmenaquinone methyltransferase/2-methoxy-6-polyprenyl-1,4-benzoquinol methylase